jgi:hypothetical protein
VLSHSLRVFTTNHHEEHEGFLAGSRPDWFAAGNTAPPTLLGHEFHRLVLPEFDFDAFGLHLWIWRSNPAGLFEDFNPKISLCG